MAGLFDDLIPGSSVQQAAPKTGLFDDLIPQAKPAAATPAIKPQHPAFDPANVPGGVPGYDAKTGMVSQPAPLSRSIDSAVRGAADALTFGLADEIAAAGGAATGIGGTFGDYSGNLERQRAENKIRSAEDPISSTAGMLGGAALSSALIPGAGAETLLGRVGQGALTGAGQGAAYGFGSGEGGVGNRLENAAVGGAIGGALGGALPAVTDAAGTLLSPITKSLSAWRNPEGMANSKVLSVLDKVGITPDELATQVAERPGMAAADLLGAQGRNMLRAATNASPEARAATTDALIGRQMDQAARLKSALTDTFADPDSYVQSANSLREAARSAAAPLYEEAYKTAMPMTPSLQSFLFTPAGKSALEQAQKLAANERKPFSSSQMDARGWDYMKRALDDMIGAQTDPLTKSVSNEGRILTGLKNAMLNEVDAANPAYKAARAAYAGPAQINDALEFGLKALDMRPEQLKNAIAGMTPEQLQAVRTGAAENVRKMLDTASPTNDMTVRAFGTPQREANMQALFESPEKYAVFKGQLADEMAKRQTYNAVRGNSTTAAQLNDMAQLADSGPLDTIMRNGPVRGAIELALKGLGKAGGMSGKVGQSVAEKLMSSDPAVLGGLANSLNDLAASGASKQAQTAAIQDMVTRMLSTSAVGARGRQ